MSKTERLFHPRTLVIHPDFKNLEEFIVSIPERFQRNEGTVIHQGRNELRKMEYNGKEYVIKSFHSPHLINRFVYGIFRPSKAKRSYDHAEMLLKIGVGTPQPVGYMNIRSGCCSIKVIISASSPPAPTFTTTCSHSNSTTPRKYSAP